MSVDSVSASSAPARPADTSAARFSTRFFRSELWLIFGRRRNWVGLAVLCAVPILVNVATKISSPNPGDGPTFLSDITNNGLFAALASLVLELPLFLPIA